MLEVTQTHAALINMTLSYSFNTYCEAWWDGWTIVSWEAPLGHKVSLNLSNHLTDWHLKNNSLLKITVLQFTHLHVISILYYFVYLAQQQKNIYTISVDCSEINT